MKHIDFSTDQGSAIGDICKNIFYQITKVQCMYFSFCFDFFLYSMPHCAKIQCPTYCRNKKKQSRLSTKVHIHSEIANLQRSKL